METLELKKPAYLYDTKKKRMDSERWLRSYQLLQEYELGNALDVHRRLRSCQTSQRADQ